MRSSIEWLGDLWRLTWGLPYWNVRKSLFRIRGARGAAPCQHPSDSGRAGHTACEACLGWRNLDRFQRLCPLLGTAADGRRVCSVDAGDVRPFWGRAAAFYGGSVAALVLLAAIGAFSAFRAIGYQVPFYAVAWPPAWHRIQEARAEYFYRMALRSIASGDARQSYLALSQAYALDPWNYSVALLLAQFSQIANPDFSDTLYARLLLRHGKDSEDVAQAWFRALLSRGDFASMGRLSGRMLREGPAHAPAWTQGVLFAERMDGDPGEVDRLLAGPDQIPRVARSVLSLAKDIRTGSADERRRRVEMSLGGSGTAFELYYELSRLVDLGSASDADAALEGLRSATLEPYDRESLKLDAYSVLDWRIMERREIGLLFERGASAPLMTLMAGHLIRHPDADTAGYVFGLLDLKPLPPAADNFGARAALLCMAGVNGLDQRMKHEADLLGWSGAGNSATWGRIREFFGSPAPGKNPAAFLPALPELPLEVVYALTAHYRASAPPAATHGAAENPPAAGRGPRP